LRVISMRSARGVVAGMCALLAMVAGSCGGGGGGSTSSNPPPPSSVSITISPTSATVGFGGTDQFTATVSGTAKTGVTWSVKDSSGGTSHVGTITSGLYTAPAATSATAQGLIHTVSVTGGQTTSSVNVPVPELNSVNLVTVTATSQADTTKSASATVTLSGLSIVGLGQCTQSGTTLNCSAGSTGTPVSRGQTVYIFIVGYGIVPGTTYAISGSDVTIPQQPTSANNNFVTTKDGTPAVFFQITISPTAALGQRNIAVTNSGGELSAFPGGLQITQ